MPWLYLMIAGFCEVGWAIGLKYTHGWTRPAPSAATIVVMVASIIFLTLAEKSIPIGTAYAVWTGIGAVGTAIFGMILFGEPHATARLVCIGLTVSGIVGLKLVSK